MQVIHNVNGEAVEVLDHQDLSRWLWKGLLAAMCTGSVIVWRVSAQNTNTQRDIASTQADIAEVQRELPAIHQVQKTMDSLIVELRVTREMFRRVGR